MADIDLKTETPDTTLPATGFLFGADSQASASPSVYRTQAVATTLLGSTTLSGTTITANAPVVDFAQTWSNAAVTFTGAKLNITDTASNAASLLMDLQVGGASRFSVQKQGLFSAAASLALNTNFSAVLWSGAQLGWASTASVNTSTTPDLLLTRRGAANLRLGAADAAASATVTITIATPGVVTWSSHGLSTGTPVIFSTTGALPTGITAGTTYYAIVVDTNTIRIATSLANALAGTAVNTSGSQSGTQTGSRGAIAQTSSVQSVVAGTTNFPGADKIITGSQGTGSGAGGSLIFQVAPAGSSGSAQNALATALTIDSARLATFAGFIRVDGGSISDAAIKIGNSNTGFFGIDTSNFGLVAGNVEIARFQSNGQLRLPSSISLSWNSDTFLARDDANKLALRNGTAAQEFRVYNTFTSASVFERGFMRFVSNELQIGGEQTGGTDRSLAIVANASANYMRSGGNWIFQSTNGGTGYFALSNGDAANRMIIRNAALSDAPLIQIGGTSSSFPALKRSTTFLQARLADDSAFAGFASANMQAATAYTVATLPGTPGTGMIARVTDATAPTIGTTVVGGGAAYALVNYNGANWTVIGV